LSEPQRGRLAEQIASIDFAQIERLIHGAAKQDNWAALAQRAQPPVAFRLDGSGNRFSTEEARAAGEAALKRGEIGAILVAGGQGTRMGFDQPKGMYPIGPVSKASLFQILLGRLLAVGRRYGKAAPLYLMTSYATHAETEQYLKQNNYFGLRPGDVRLFCQGTMPAVDAGSGRVLLDDKGEVALSPDGHGGMLAALVRSGGLADFQRRGVKHLFYFQVDNPLAEVCGPLFLGYHIMAKSEMSTLAVAKREALERVGNMAQVDGKTRIIEYSDLPDDVAKQTNPDGSLRLWAGNTAIHVIDVAFLNRVQGLDDTLPFHTARKKVAHIDEQGKHVELAEPNAFKFERFIFDLLPAAQRAIVVEADAAQSFAPVKNAPGDKRDSPDTAREMMVALHRRWLEAAGAKVAPNVAVEIGPLFALDADDVKKKIKSGMVISKDTYLQ
jgi:UDP-N-acetylglucosamine/UDP-N-acetylgalactosamine diphosphorylase